MSIPTFAIIGAMKAGTTTLFEWLQRDARVCMAQIKEPGYFNTPGVFLQPRVSDLAEYIALFSHPELPTGEASTGYTKFPADRGVAKRLSVSAPNVRLIYVLRNPIDRFLSHLHHVYRRISPHLDFNTWCASEPKEHYLNVSSYSLQVDQYVACFPIEQLLLVTTELLENQPEDFMARIYRHIGLSPCDLDYETFPRLNVASYDNGDPVTLKWRAYAKEHLAGDVHSLRRRCPGLCQYWNEDFPIAGGVSISH